MVKKELQLTMTQKVHISIFNVFNTLVFSLDLEREFGNYQDVFKMMSNNQQETEQLQQCHTNDESIFWSIKKKGKKY